MQKTVKTDLEVIFEKLPPHVAGVLAQREDTQDLLEIVLDLGRAPEARFLSGSVDLTESEVTEEDIQYVIQRISPFGSDNRAGIERTLHRISAIRNRTGKVVGLTIRVGRAVYGTIKIMEDLVLTGKSILLLGKPGVGKTTMLREVARVLADDAFKRVVVVDTSNEIAGDGDIPHPGIGRARRMQVPSADLQHAVMIEAVENHMPEVIIVDEIGTELEAGAARTIAERGVQLVATAHGNTIENLIQNPTLSDLIGGIQSVTLGDIEARRRRTQKTVLERKAPPTFDVVVEIQGWSQVVIHPDVADVVDHMLRGFPATLENRTVDEAGRLSKTQVQREPVLGGQRSFEDGRDRFGRSGRRSYDANGRGGPREQPSSRGEFAAPPSEVLPSMSYVDDDEEEEEAPPVKVTRILPYGVNKGKLFQVVEQMNAPINVVDDIDHADILLTTKNFYRKRTQALRQAEERGRPVYVLRKNTNPQIHEFVRAIVRHNTSRRSNDGSLDDAIKEAETAADRVTNGETQAELSPQGSYIRRLQHQIAEQHGLASTSAGREPSRHVVIFRG